MHDVIDQIMAIKYYTMDPRHKWEQIHDQV